METESLYEMMFGGGLAKGSFEIFIEKVEGDRFTWGEHQRRIAKVLEAWATGRLPSGNKNLMVVLPVRHGKSKLGSQLCPAWCAGVHARTDVPMQIIQACYSLDHACEMEDYTKTIIKTSEYRQIFPDIRINPKRDNFRTFQMLCGNRKAVIYQAAGVESGIVGKGAFRLFLDDLIRGRNDAHSQICRDKAWNWFISDVTTRQMPGFAVMMIGTHWHEDDPIGRAIQLMQDDSRAMKWDVICLPAILDEETFDNPLWQLGQKGPCPDWRRLGEALWPEWYPIEVLQGQMVDPYTWDALYQQRPRSSLTGVLQTAWFNRCKIQPDDAKLKDVCMWCRGVDLAVTGKTSGDYMSGVLLGLMRNGDIVIRHVYRFKKPWAPQGHDELLRQARQDGHKVAIAMACGGQQGGYAETLANTDSDFAPFVIESFSEPGSKLTRALEWAGRASRHRIWMVAGDWNKDWLRECNNFTGMDDKEDDQIDAFWLAYRYFCEHASWVLAKGNVTVKKTVDTDSDSGIAHKSSSPVPRRFGRRTFF